jgi:hypothetical protein
VIILRTHWALPTDPEAAESTDGQEMIGSIAALLRRCGAWLALLAFALQLGLSAAHVHELNWDFYRTNGLTRAGANAGLANDRSPAHSPAVPPEDRCPICFALAVSGTFVPPTATLIIHAPVPTAADLDISVEITDLPRRPLTPAQPRAPPPIALPA